MLTGSAAALLRAVLFLVSLFPGTGNQCMSGRVSALEKIGTTKFAVRVVFSIEYHILSIK